MDNQRRAQEGLRLSLADFPAKRLTLDAFVGGAEYDWELEYSGGGVFKGGDGYISSSLHYEDPSFALGFNYLPDGVGSEEEGWGGDIAWRWSGDKWVREEWAKMWTHQPPELWSAQRPRGATGFSPTCTRRTDPAAGVLPRRRQFSMYVLHHPPLLRGVTPSNQRARGLDTRGNYKYLDLDWER